MTRIATLVALALVAMSGSSVACGGQSLGRISAEAVVGSADGQGGEFRSRNLLLWRVGGAVVIATKSGVAALAGIEHEHSFGQDKTSICVLGPSGRCLPSFPSLTGTLGTLGLRSPVFHQLVGGVSMGVGEHETDTERSFSSMVQADGAVRIGWRVWLTIGTRRTQVESIHGDRLHVVSMTGGLRIH